ncbi:lytic murein transglycosylase [Paremcibacter congregatus]|uniref:lytic murein transglycosylase n=1 Tax=Paremcibacter congregatus TaxID=2043170 RepID=UPI0030EF6BFA
MITRIILTFSILIMSFTNGAIAKDRVVPDNPQPFEEWVADLKTEALGKGISESVFEAAFQDITPDPKVIKLDRHQPEFTQTYFDYISKRVSQTRIKNGLKKVAENADDLAAVEDKIGVQQRFIAGIWGMETNYGGYTGGYNVIKSLATLAYDMRRPTYFRSQLLGALRILEEGHITPEDFKGSWAGAMGQGQFMPTSFFAYAYDFDGDAKKDIWTNQKDVYASIANYLKKHGWESNRTWGRQVRLPQDIDGLWEKVKQTGKVKSCRRALKDHSIQLSLPEWQALGVRTIYGADLPKVTDPDFTASLVMPAGKDGPAFLTYKNFRAILSYNCSNYYALGVSLLSDELK